MLGRRRARLLAFALVFLPTVALAWWQPDWPYRKALTVNLPADVGAGAVAADVPVLIRLHAGNFEYFADTAPDGADLRLIAADDVTPLAFHVERYDPTGGMALVWVRVPQLTAGIPQPAYLYYGNSDAPAGSDPASSYDAAQALVWHFGADGPVRDATANGNHATASTAAWQAGSLIGGGMRLDPGVAISAPAATSLVFDPAQGLTLSLWVKTDGAQTGALAEFGTPEQGLVLALEDGVPVVSLVGAAPVQARASAPLSAGAWQHLAVTLSTDSLTLYVDGAAQTPATLTGAQGFGGAVALGAGPVAQALELPGAAFEVDEFGVARTARTPQWLRSVVLAQGPAGGLVTAGADESAEDSGAGHGSYIGVVLQNVTIDGWVIIGMLSVMSALSWVVMFGKGRFLAQVRRANVAFLDAFGKLEEGHIGALEAVPAVTPAPLYRVYAAAIGELSGRLHRSAGAQAAGLSPQGLDALRASVDAAAVREQQRLNSQMVLLTIAISGGPFLGLLGTVVGVMITFAAIAASGDVNVNSIAPGIAAALVATVAGLLVAIPALFGYNYLGTLIRDTTTDLRVFVDELIARIAEQHGA